MFLDLPGEMHHDRAAGPEMVPAVLLRPLLFLPLLCNSCYTCYDESIRVTHKPDTARGPRLDAHRTLPSSAQGPYKKLLGKTLQHQTIGSTFPAQSDPGSSPPSFSQKHHQEGKAREETACPRLEDTS